jgi:hypothetical protein
MAELQQPRRQTEALPVGLRVPGMDQGEQEAPRAGARQARLLRHLRQRHPRLVPREGLQHLEGAQDGMHQFTVGGGPRRVVLGPEHRLDVQILARRRVLMHHGASSSTLSGMLSAVRGANKGLPGVRSANGPLLARHRSCSLCESLFA